MTPRWAFSRHRAGERARNSQVEKFFRSEEVADRTTALVREGIQNSLDAATRDSVNVRIGIGKVTASALAPYTPGLFLHLNAIRHAVEDVPIPQEEVRYLVFEDFNTKGLEGDPRQWNPPSGEKNPFYDFFWGEGVSHKSDNERGRHGVGKTVFAVASRARCLFGLSITEDGPPRLMGTATLPRHECNDTTYQPDGWYGIESAVDTDTMQLPVEDADAVNHFCETFGLEREGLPGLSIVVPWLPRVIKSPHVVERVIRGYFWPIITGGLHVDVTHCHQTIRIDAATIENVVSKADGQFQKEVGPQVALARWAHALSPEDRLDVPAPESSRGAQDWSNEQLADDVRAEIRQRLDEGRKVALRLRIQLRLKGSTDPLPSEFFVYFQRDPDCRDADVSFFREGLLVSGVKPLAPRTCSGYRALVIVEKGPLASFLWIAENPSHTKWEKENLKDKYMASPSCLKYVTGSLSNILRAISQEDQQADPTLLLDMFSLPDPDPGDRTARGRKARKKPGGTSDVPDVKVPTRPKRFETHKRASGFRIGPGDVDADRPERIEVRIAYDVRRGNPFKRYDPADFNTAKAPISINVEGCSIVEQEDNRLVVDIQNDQFQIDVSGFDSNRDLRIDSRVKEKEPADAAAV